MSSTITVAQISDSHLKREPGTGEGSPDEMLRRAVALVAEAQPDVLLLTGDIADDGSTEAYARVAQAVKVLGVPVLATAGNHDDPAAVAEAFGAVDELSIGGWRVLLFDTTIPKTEHGRIAVADVVRRLGPDNGVPTLLGLHHPPITTSTHPWMRLEGGSELVAALTARSDVRVVVSGHLHEAFNAVLGGVSYIGCSSSFYSIKHRNEQFILDHGHVGALMLSLASDGDFKWRRLPDPHEVDTVLGPME
ncbi:MAG: metallophosphoesterase [Actinomycetia bacterium]|nr:metallophosphoesterase [Actinomycetes bacterium]